MESENIILKKIKEQLDTVGVEHEKAKCELDSLVESFITNITNNIKKYVVENIKRESRKSPDAAESLDDARIDALRDELNGQLEPEVERITTELRDNTEWYDVDTAFLDTNSKAWESVKSIEPPVNSVLTSYGLNAISLKNWSWLSADVDAMMTMRFPAAKKEFVDKRKQLKYLQDRFREESRMGSILGKLDSL